MILLTAIWVFSWMILLGYHVFIFSPRQKTKTSSAGSQSQGVSVVIPVRNGSRLLEAHLPFLLKQDFPVFEIILVDDHSEISEQKRLKALVQPFQQVRLIHSTTTPGKKPALQQAIEAARYPWILCTDVDCKPRSDQWIKKMVEGSEGESLVLGYSPYSGQRGILNFWIRFETVITAMQYFSWASLNKPFMGVGRNLLFSRDWFIRVDPFRNASQVPYGDDDLLVQRATEDAGVTYSMVPETFVESVPVDTWTSWWKQKHRHLSAGHQYSRTHWLKPGVYGIALVSHWWILVLTGWKMGLWLWILFAGGLFIRSVRHIQWTDRLGEKDTRIWYPVLEAAYTLYLALMGTYTLFYPKKKWS